MKITTVIIPCKRIELSVESGYYITSWQEGDPTYTGYDNLCRAIGTDISMYYLITAEEHERLKELYGEKLDAPEQPTESAQPEV